MQRGNPPRHKRFRFQTSHMLDRNDTLMHGRMSKLYASGAIADRIDVRLGCLHIFVDINTGYVVVLTAVFSSPKC